MDSNITKAERKKIKSDLKFGDIALIARISKKSVSTVNRWFKDQGDCFEIPKAINQLFDLRQNTMKNFRNSLDSIDV